MPWCPRCDETFPEGPACPRCSARLVARERETPEDTLHTVPGLKAIKVSRRYLKAFERLNAGPRPSSSRALALALVLLVFASGFLLGRVGSVGVTTPAVHALPLAEPLPFNDVKKAVSYLISTRDGVATIAMHDLFSGEITPRAQFSLPMELGAKVTTRVVSFGRSVAIVASADGRGWVAFAPYQRPAQAWVPGVQAGWLSESELLVRGADGEVTKWSAGADSVDATPVGDADELIATDGGAVVRRGKTIETVNRPHRSLGVPDGEGVLAVAPDTTRAVIDPARPALWSEGEKTRLRSGSGKAIGASFEPSGQRAAVLLAKGEELTLAITDAQGNTALKPLGGAPCETTPAWDALGQWIYVATSDGVLHAVEANGGRIEAIKTHSVGCGLAWVDVGIETR